MGQIARQDGTLYPGVDFKLLDVEEYGYKKSDKPFPRGELLVFKTMLKKCVYIKIVEKPT